jgi:hypothetical protein
MFPIMIQMVVCSMSLMETNRGGWGFGPAASPRGFGSFGPLAGDKKAQCNFQQGIWLTPLLHPQTISFMMFPILSCYASQRETVLTSD